MKKENRLYNCSQPIIGITGGIGTGKSSVAKIFKAKGQLIIDADSIVKRIYQKQSTITWLLDHLPEVITKENTIDFKKFRKIFFSETKTKELIESFIYPQMSSIFLSDIKDSPTIIFYDVPLLFEKKLNLKIDKSIVVSCSDEIQIQRVCKRDNISRELAINIISQQMPLQEKINMCDYHIDNSATLEDLENNSLEILEKIKKDII